MCFDILLQFIEINYITKQHYFSLKESILNIKIWDFKVVTINSVEYYAILRYVNIGFIWILLNTFRTKRIIQKGINPSNYIWHFKLFSSLLIPNWTNDVLLNIKNITTMEIWYIKDWRLNYLTGPHMAGSWDFFWWI